MNALPPPLPPPSITTDDVLYVLLRQKWKILVCGALGLLACGAVCLFYPPPYQSEAKLFVRYVLENSNPGPQRDDSRAVSPAQQGDAIMNTEMEILASMDIAKKVVDTIGPDKIIGKIKGPRDRNGAAAVLKRDLFVGHEPNGSVLHLVFQNPNPNVVQPVLNAIIDAYLKKHVEVHRGAGAVGNFLNEETDQLRARLAQTEEELRAARGNAGIISLDDATKAYSAEEAQIQQQIFSATAELAERSAMLDELKKNSLSPLRPAPSTSAGASSPAIPDAQIESYADLREGLASAKKTEQQLLGEFTPQNQRVQDARARIADLEASMRKMEEKYPEIARLGSAAMASPASAVPRTSVDLDAEAARLTGLQSKIKVLYAQLDEVRKKENKVQQLDGSISELQRQKELEETNYRYFATHLEANRIDEALGSGRALNIAEIQTPTSPYVSWTKTWKIMGILGVGGFAVGICWAFLIEFVLDQTIRRPRDLEREIPIPLFLSIPDFGRNGHNKHVFHETLRDRLIAYFESKGLTHKPKLVAVTGVSKKSGVTTTASGLARCLSETGDGNVLLVDMTVSQGSAQQFYNGKAVRGMNDLLETRSTALVQEKLYVVGAQPNSEKLSVALPTRFKGLVPQLKASDFDYIIFDMPLVNQISITPRLAGFMDMVLMVVESEHTNRDIAQQAATLLAESRAHVGVVLNKTRNYLPSKQQHDFLGNS